MSRAQLTWVRGDHDGAIRVLGGVIAQHAGCQANDEGVECEGGGHHEDIAEALPAIDESGHSQHGHGGKEQNVHPFHCLCSRRGTMIGVAVLKGHNGGGFTCQYMGL